MKYIGSFPLNVNKANAATSMAYGLSTALIAVVLISILAVVGSDVSNVFLETGNVISAKNSLPPTLGAPNPNLTAAEQSQITNSASEIANGTASMACLMALNSDASHMAANNATCLGPGLGIKPPPAPVAIIQSNLSNTAIEVQSNGLMYAQAAYNTYGTGTGVIGTSAYFVGTGRLAFYADGYIDSLNWFGADSSCGNGNGLGLYTGSMSPTTNSNGSITCTGHAQFNGNANKASYVGAAVTTTNIGTGNMGYYEPNGAPYTW